MLKKSVGPVIYFSTAKQRHGWMTLAILEYYPYGHISLYFYPATGSHFSAWTIMNRRKGVGFTWSRWRYLVKYLKFCIPSEWVLWTTVLLYSHQCLVMNDPHHVPESIIPFHIYSPHGKLVKAWSGYSLQIVYGLLVATFIHTCFVPVFVGKFQWMIAIGTARVLGLSFCSCKPIIWWLRDGIQSSVSPSIHHFTGAFGVQNCLCRCHLWRMSIGEFTFFRHYFTKSSFIFIQANW